MQTRTLPPDRGGDHSPDLQIMDTLLNASRRTTSVCQGLSFGVRHRQRPIASDILWVYNLRIYYIVPGPGSMSRDPRCAGFIPCLIERKWIYTRLKSEKVDPYVRHRANVGPALMRYFDGCLGTTQCLGDVEILQFTINSVDNLASYDTYTP